MPRIRATSPLPPGGGQGVGVLAMLLLCASALAGCAQPLPSRALVDDLRILGVRAEPPEAPPGTSVHFDALIADPRGSGRALKLAWALCTPGSGGVASCGDPTRVALLGTNSTA